MKRLQFILGPVPGCTFITHDNQGRFLAAARGVGVIGITTRIDVDLIRRRKCDGDHGWPPCADLECWQRDGPLKCRICGAIDGHHWHCPCIA